VAARPHGPAQRAVDQVASFAEPPLPAPDLAEGVEHARDPGLGEARDLVDRALRGAVRPGGHEGAVAGLMRGTRARVLRDQGDIDEADAEQARGLALVEATRGRGWQWEKMRADYAAKR
jgi:hypothetical protein